jgi:hypothetical protein
VIGEVTRHGTLMYVEGWQVGIMLQCCKFSFPVLLIDTILVSQTLLYIFDMFGVFTEEIQHRLSTDRIEGKNGQLMKTREVKGETNQNAMSYTSPEWKICINCFINVCRGSHCEHSFNVHGSVHRNNILIYIQQDATLQQFILSGNCSTCFG